MSETRVKYSLLYDGPRARGELPADKFARSLLGVHSSIKKLCARDSELKKVNILAEAPKDGSFLIEIVAQITAGVVTSEIITNGLLTRKLTKKLIVLTEQFKIKKLVKNDEYKIIPKFKSDETERAQIINESTKESIEVETESAEVFQEKLIEEDIGKIVEALEKENVNSLKISIAQHTVVITDAEKEYFSAEARVLKELKHDQKVNLIGEITRINKRRNTLGFSYKGMIIDCRPAIPDEGVKENVITYLDFLKDPSVKLTGIVHWTEESEKPIIYIEDIQPIQNLLNLPKSI